MLIQRHLQKIVFTADEAHGASHPDRFRWASLRPIQRERSRDYSSWRSARQVWAVIKHSRALHPKRDPTGVIPFASASPRAMFALTTELPFRMTHWSSGKDWSVRGKVWKLGCVSYSRARTHAPRAAGTQLAFSVNTGRCSFMCGAARCANNSAGTRGFSSHTPESHYLLSTYLVIDSGGFKHCSHFKLQTCTKKVQ